jgi:hypothetical protein
MASASGGALGASLSAGTVPVQLGLPFLWPDGASIAFVAGAQLLPATLPDIGTDTGTGTGIGTGTDGGTGTGTGTGTNGGGDGETVTVTATSTSISTVTSTQIDTITQTTTAPLAAPAPVPSVSGFKLAPSAKWSFGNALPALLEPSAKLPKPPVGRLSRGACVKTTTSNRRAHRCTLTGTGVVFSFRLSVAAKVQLGFQRILAGRVVGGRCVLQTTRNRRGHKACVFYAKAQSVAAAAARAGTNLIRFQGRLNSRARLVVGAKYRPVLTTLTSAGKPITGYLGPRFEIVKQPAKPKRRS